MLHTIEMRYIIDRKHSFINHGLYGLKVLGYSNRDKDFDYNTNNQFQSKQIYGILTNNNKFSGYYLRLPEQGITFEYPAINNPLSYLFVIINLNKFLKKDEIVESDLTSFKDKYYEFINRVFYKDPLLQTEALNRIDYKRDYKAKNSDEKTNLLTILKMANDKRYSLERKTPYKTTVYYNSEDVNINIYDKYEESGLEKYRDILRYEVQVKTGLLQRYYKEYGILRNIDNYWNMRNFFFIEYLEPLLFNGNYYLNQNLKSLMKGKKNRDTLFDKILRVQETESIANIYTSSQKQQLQKIGINPIQNDFSCKNPLGEIFSN